MISQPMTNKSIFQIENERKELTKKLQDEGHEVVDTIFTEDAPLDCNPGLWYMAKSIEAMSKVDCVVFMKGWETCKGCAIEEMCAKKYGIMLKYE